MSKKYKRGFCDGILFGVAIGVAVSFIIMIIALKTTHYNNPGQAGPSVNYIK